MRDKAKSASKGSVKEQEWIIRQGDREQQDKQESMGSMSAATGKAQTFLCWILKSARARALSDLLDT